MSLITYLCVLCAVVLTPTVTVVLFSMANGMLQGNGTAVVPSDGPSLAYYSQIVKGGGMQNFKNLQF